jgi:hypothetical protein
MTAQKKIEQLTDTWYGFALFAGVVSVLVNGIGFFSIGIAVASTFVSLLITFVVGRLLLRRSSLTRLVVMVVAALSTISSALALVKFVSDISFSGLIGAVLMAVTIYMNVRSLRVLTDSSVKAFFRG